MTVHYKIEVKDKVLVSYSHGFKNPWATLHIIDAENSVEVPPEIEKIATDEFMLRQKEIRIVKFHTIKKYYSFKCMGKNYT